MRFRSAPTHVEQPGGRNHRSHQGARIDPRSLLQQPSHAGPWVEFTHILYDCELGTYEWMGKVLVALPTPQNSADESCEVFIDSSQKVLEEGHKQQTCTKHESMSRINTSASHIAVSFWMCKLRVRMHATCFTEVLYTIRRGALDIQSRFRVAPHDVPQEWQWTIITLPSVPYVRGPWRSKHALLQIQTRSYEELCQFGENSLAHIPYLCQGWYRPGGRTVHVLQ
ncbi:unnamed protein product [Aspergillus oryzae]|nr:unnamed protein product [Aspergillus oryzae]